MGAQGQHGEPEAGIYCSRVMQQFSLLQVVQEGAENQFLNSLAGKQGCLEGGRYACSHFWCLLVLKLPMGNLLDSLLLECLFSKAGLVPVEAACKIVSVLSGHELFAQRTGSVWI